jgi:phenylalanyl-tRNA synthetase beta chain
MIISYAWLCELLGADPGVDVVARALTDAGLEVERVARVGEHLAPVVVAVVKSARPHPSSKNPLSLVTVDVGDGDLEIVCGAPNVPSPGGRVLFAPVGATVFGGDGQPFTLVEKPVAGIVSRGMLCSEVELGLGADGGGIVVLDEPLPAGTPLTRALPGAVDAILEVNVTPNRPDALGHLGVARDVAALLSLPFAGVTVAPLPRRPAQPDERARVASETLACPRLCAAVMARVTVRPSPLWLRARLFRLGVRAINNVVDASNLVMLELGQPNHAYDLDRVSARTLIARGARDGETLATLDGVARTLTISDVVIADPERPVGLAGVMGGADSAISDGTTRVLLEAASFDASTVRKMSRRHGIHSDASHRFERGVDPASPSLALARLESLLVALAGAEAIDAGVEAHGPVQPPEAPRVTVRTARVATVLGLPVPVAEAARILRALGFAVERESAEELTVRVPSWRPDVTREIDVIEEIGRVHGLDRVPLAVVPSSGARAGARRDYALRRRVREALAALGLDEAVNYAFDARRLFEQAATTPSARIANPLSEDRAVMRPSLVPGLLQAAAIGVRHGEPRARLFEVGTVFSSRAPSDPLADESKGTDANVGPLDERTHVAFVLVGPRDGYLSDDGGVDVLDGKGVVESLVESLSRATVTAERAGDPPGWAHPAAYGRLRAGESVLGFVAELHPTVREAFRLPPSTVVCELSLSALGEIPAVLRAIAPSRLPAVRRDVALLVSRAQPAGAVAHALQQAAGPRCASVVLFDRYVGRELPEGTHSLAYTLVFTPVERAFTDAEVDAWVRAALDRAAAEFGASQR